MSNARRKQRIRLGRLRSDSPIQKAVIPTFQIGATTMAKKTQDPISVKISNGRLIIDAPVDENPSPSASGKTLVIASSHGNMTTDQKFDGQAVVVGFNAYIKNLKHKG